MKDSIIDLHNKYLSEIDIDEHFLKNYFDANLQSEVVIDLSYNNLSEISAIKILEHLFFSQRELIYIDFSNNHINFINNELITKIISFLNRFSDARINIRNNPNSESIMDFINYNLLDKIIYS